MAARLTLGRLLSGPEEWTRRRLQVLLILTAGVLIAVVVGIVWSIGALLDIGRSHPTRAQQAHQHVVTQGGDIGDASIEDAEPGPISNQSAATIPLPQPRTVGAAQVGTGFSRSTPGALAQLIAIDQRAIGSASVVTAQDVVAAWAAPGGPSPQSWSGVRAVQTLLDAAGLPANGSSEVTIDLSPQMGLVRDHNLSVTTVCVDFVVSAAISDRQPERIAVADCQHMTWRADHWQIAAGPEPTRSPSLWPGTRASYEAGYEWLEIQP